MALNFTDPSLVYQIDAPLLIEASAGSGKTTILTERWVAVFIGQLAWDGLDPSQALAAMAALTFSRKAAAEMKERIRARLDELFEEGGLEALLSQLQAFRQKKINIPQSAENLRAQKAFIDDMIASAQISTIDSFILAALRQNPLELPEETPIDPKEKDLLEAEAQKLTLRACLNGALSPGLQKAFAMGVALCGFKGWQAFFKSLRSKSSSMGEGAFTQALINSGFLSKQQVALSAPDAAALYQLFIKAPLGRLIEAMQSEAAYKELPTDNKALLHNLLDIDEETFMGLFQKKIFPQYQAGKPVKNEELISLREISLKAAQILADACTDAALSLMLPLSNHCGALLQNLRKEKGTSSFSENTALFLKALQSGPMAEKIQSRLRYFFADEFQDTSPEQYQIFSLISGQAVPFYVGDPKQSIYGFRGADAAVFQRAAEEFRQKNWRTAILTENRRSCPSHVHFVNDIFSEAFAQGAISYIPQIPLKEGAGYLGYTLAPEKPSKEDSPSKTKAPEEPTQSFAEALSFIRKENLEGTPYGDILVLFRTKNEILQFYSYLKNTAPEIPVSSSQRANLFKSPYISPLMGFLRAIDNPSDELRLIALLKGVFFRKDDQQISALLSKARRAGTPLYNVLPPADTALIAPYISLKGRILLAELISRFVKESSYEFILEQGMGEALATLRLFIEELQNIELNHSLSLDGFLRLIDEEGIEALEAEFSGGEGKNVRLLTMHNAKGLESNCVIYICRNSKVLRNSSELYPLEIGGRIAFDAFGKGLLAEELKTAKEQQDFNEEKRLIYVALTRAKTSFYLCGLPSLPDKPSPLKIGHILNKELFGQKYPGHLTSQFEAEARPPVQNINEDDAVKERYLQLKSLDQAANFSSYPQTLSVAQLLDAEFSPQRFFRSAEDLSESLRDMGEDGFELAMPSPADIGTMVHACLQQFDKADAPQLNAYLQLNFPEFDSAFDEVQRLAFNYLQSPFYQNLSASATHKEKERSVQMLLSIEGAQILLRSVADLYVEGGKKRIVDYKLSLGSNLDRYKRQLSYYAYLSEAAGYPVDELALFILKESKEYLFPYAPGETKTAFNKAVEAALKIWKKA